MLYKEFTYFKVIANRQELAYSFVIHSKSSITILYCVFLWIFMVINAIV
ncbi:hypothetical protein BN165_710002 [Clostridioides difficile E1]|nr:hypothetical protein BN163_760002 [Clostridioides difficile T5]CCK93314.1 hypothetical protein BN164_700002 [Clostridioides difficile T20]CCK96943.1 hypothetical protein BN165_710002 [Clostridioides difficile E1]CCL00280.1 hypothetical protein BN166_2700002 [Clostridioides difficile E10]